MKRIACCAWIMILVATTILVATPMAQAVIIRGGDGSGNTNAPPDDPGWANVGSLGDNSAVYIANGWVLTTGHTGPGPVVFGGKTYEPVPDSWRRIRDPLRPDQLVDLGLFQIQGEPVGARNLIIGRKPPLVGTIVLGIGSGRNREKDVTTWYIDPYSHPNVWKETSFPEAKSVRTGFKYADGQSKRWGMTRINRLCSDLDYGQGPTCAIEMMFCDSGGCGDNEMQLTDRDSGGALFRKVRDTWELVGILASKGCMDGQPENTAVFGNLSYAVDLSAYADEIRTTVYGPDPSILPPFLLNLIPLVIPIGSALGGLTLIALVAWYYRRWKRKQEWDFEN